MTTKVSQHKQPLCYNLGFFGQRPNFLCIRLKKLRQLGQKYRQMICVMSSVDTTMVQMTEMFHFEMSQ